MVRPFHRGGGHDGAPRGRRQPTGQSVLKTAPVSGRERAAGEALDAALAVWAGVVEDEG
jgi:hypothetical protein